jgi:serine/threonine protein kinase
MIDTLGPYKILDRIGAGGLGEVYRARDGRHGRTVAIKVLPGSIADDQERRERFLRDAHDTAILSHPNIATLYEVSEDQDHLFLVFDFVPGQSLKTIIGGRPLNPRRAVDLAAQTADALAEAHSAGIVHRDIKPDNVIVTPRGNAKILDYGLAAWTTGGEERRTSMSNGSSDSPSATMPYMSPEQVLGEQGDDRTDIFSLGVVLFEMLTGRLPFTGQTRTALVMQIMHAPAPAPSAVNASLPPELDLIVSKALAKSIDQRYASAATLAAELRSVAAILDVRTAADERPLMPVPPRAVRWSVTRWIALALAIVALAAAAWFIRIR